MHTTVIFTPTYRPGGIDVLEASLMRQSDRNFIWVVADELRYERKATWYQVLDRVDFPIMFIDQPIKEGNKRNLAALYNRVADYYSKDGSKVFISLQDYMYLPENGVARFNALCEDNPNDLITGVTHISRDPYPNKIKNINGKYTIFEEPYTDKPKRMSWEDVRVTELYIDSDPDAVVVAETGHWEANWAAVPIDLFKRGARWDEEYDKGIAYENMDFAQQCHKNFNSRVILDKGNVAISLPHKDYFEGEREEIVEFSNRELYENKWTR